MDPTWKEKQLQRTAKLLVYVLQSRGKPVSLVLLKTSQDQYATEDFVSVLCGELREMELHYPHDFTHVVYNARNKTSRDLADWWDDHQEADREREEAEASERRLEELRRSAKAKLTPEEIEALLL